MKILRYILPVILLAGVLIYSGPQEVFKIFLEIDLLQLVLLFAISFLLLWVSCIKWRMFLRAAGINPPMGKLLKLYVLGYFVNLVSPSTLGGDLVRSYQLGKELGNHQDSFSATFLERFTGMLAMTSLGFFFLIAGSNEVKGFEIPVMLVFLATLMLACAAFTRIGFQLFDAAVRACLRGEGGFVSKLRAAMLKLEVAFEYARGNYALFVKTFFVSLVFHSIAILNTKVAANAVGWWEAPVGELFVVVPLVLVVSAIPLTPSGIGIQEGAFVFFLQRLGATRGEAAGVAILLRAKALALGLLGGLIWLTLSRRGRRKD